LPISTLFAEFPGTADHAVADKREVLQVGAQDEVDVRRHQIDASAGRLDGNIERVVDDVDVVPRAAGHRVGARTAV
jgi:hypothetical protein